MAYDQTNFNEAEEFYTDEFGERIGNDDSTDTNLENEEATQDEMTPEQNQSPTFGERLGESELDSDANTDGQTKASTTDGLGDTATRSESDSANESDRDQSVL